MDFNEMREFIRDVSSVVREDPIWQRYTEEIIAWRLRVVADGETYDIQRTYLNDCYEQLTEEMFGSPEEIEFDCDTYEPVETSTFYSE